MIIDIDDFISSFSSHFYFCREDKLNTQNRDWSNLDMVMIFLVLYRPDPGYDMRPRSLWDDRWLSWSWGMYQVVPLRNPKNVLTK